MTVGIYTIIAVETMQVVTYVFETYELALAQAHENEKGVTERVERILDHRLPNGMRQTVWKYPTLWQLITIQEFEVGTAVLPVV